MFHPHLLSTRAALPCVAVMLCVSAWAQTRGQVDVALQGYYLGGNLQPLAALSGTQISFRTFVPGVGLLSGNLEAYDETTRFRGGENFLELRGFAWAGRRWNITGGDFRFSPTLVNFPFLNYFTPELTARGVRLDMVEGRRQYTVFWGAETLPQGPRISFRVPAPQRALGAAVRQNLGERLQLAASFVRLSSSDAAVDDHPIYFPMGREFREANVATAEAFYSITKQLRLYGEAHLSRPDFARGYESPAGSPWSHLGGLMWESPRMMVRANYGSLNASVFPVLGYFLGDRRGPFAEAKFQPFKALEFYGSASRTRNNLTNNPELPRLQSSQVSSGMSVALPWKFTANGQYSDVVLAGSGAGGQDYGSLGRQYSASIAKQMGRQALRFTAREMDLSSTMFREKQKSAEAESSVQFSRFNAAAAVRGQQSRSQQLRTSVFVRGSLQARVGPRLSAHAQFEAGNDLENKTLFSTNTLNSTVVGLNAVLPGGWTLQADAFRNGLKTELNPENLFVLQTRGIGVATTLAELNQWSLFFRVSKRLQWGGLLPDAAEKFAIERVPLVGTVEGFVRELTAEGSRPATGVSLSLDGNRSTATDVSGAYRFEEVPEGPHTVGLNMSELPADFNPGPHKDAAIAVRVKKSVRADFEVVQMGSSIQGKVEGARDARANHIVVLLSPGERYTTCDEAGNFAFFNLPAGAYRVSLDQSTLPENHQVKSAPQVDVSLTAAGVSAPVQFSIEYQEPQLPVRKVFQKDLTRP